MTVKTWAHGDTDVSAANLNAYSTDLTAAHDLIGDAVETWAVRLASGASFHIWHTARYLYFQSTGTLESMDGTESVGLSEPADGTAGVVDLDTVEWLQYGMLYKVVGVSACMEDYE